MCKAIFGVVPKGESVAKSLLSLCGVRYVSCEPAASCGMLVYICRTFLFATAVSGSPAMAQTLTGRKAVQECVRSHCSASRRPAEEQTRRRTMNFCTYEYRAPPTSCHRQERTVAALMIHPTSAFLHLMIFRYYHSTPNLSSILKRRRYHQHYSG